jgi:hypothetical protein
MERRGTVSEVVNRVVREDDLERLIREREPIVGIEDLEGAPIRSSSRRGSDRLWIHVDPRHLRTLFIGKERRDTAGSTRDIKERRHTRSEPGCELGCLRSLQPAGLPRSSSYVSFGTRVCASAPTAPYVFS